MKPFGDLRHPFPSLRRRDFLAWGSLAALAPLTPWMNRAAAAVSLGEDGGAADEPATAANGARAASAAAPVRALSAGYMEGSGELDNLRKLAPDLRVLAVTRRGNTFQAERSMMPAHELPSGDPSLVGGAVRLTVHDLYPRFLPADPAVAARWATAVDLDVLVPVDDGPPGATARFLAWSYRRLPAEDRSARVSFLVWPDWTSKLSIVLRVVPAAPEGGDPAAAPAPQVLAATFSPGGEEGTPKLLKGIYLLGLRQGIWNEQLDLPDDPSQVPPERLSVLLTVEPEGVRGGISH